MLPKNQLKLFLSQLILIIHNFMMIYPSKNQTDQ